MVDGADIIEEAAVDGQYQYEWCFVARGDGYEIKNRGSAMSMDATQSGGLNILQWSYWGGLNQQW